MGKAKGFCQKVVIMGQNQRKSGQNPSLHFMSGLRSGERFLLPGGSCIIGRDESADILLDSPTVSRQHAEIIKDGGYWYLVDLFSRNGVSRNMARVHPGERIPLQDRDEIQIGSVSVFMFLDPESTVHESQLRMMTPGLWLDEPNREVNVDDMRLDPPLTHQQFDLLMVLFHKRGGVVTNEEIAAVLWPEAAGGVERAAIDNAVSRLRARLDEFHVDHEFIETVRGVGKRFVQGPAH